jgi:hypothetical protein
MDADLAAAQARIDELIRIAKAKEERLHSRRMARERAGSPPVSANRSGDGLHSQDGQRTSGLSGLNSAGRLPPERGSSRASLASAAPTSRNLSPTADADDLLDEAPAVGGAENAVAEAHDALAPLVRRSSSLVKVEAREPNRKPLGQLQLGGRREYDGARSSCGGGALSESPRRASRGGSESRVPLTPSALPAAVVAAWQAGGLSPDLALRQMLDRVCRLAASGEHRELSAISAHLDAHLALGGALGGLAGGLPACATGGADGAAALQPLRAMLHTPPEVVTNQALRLFTAELLTGAEASAGSAAGGGAAALAADTRRLAADLGKLSAEELNLAFRRACLVRHPNRPNGSLSAFLHTHLAFELVRAVWTRLDEHDTGGGLDSTDGAVVASDGAVADELGKTEAEMIADNLPEGEIEALNGRMQARGVWWAHARELLEAQLEAMEAVGAYAVLGVTSAVTDKELTAA